MARPFPDFTKTVPDELNPTPTTELPAPVALPNPVPTEPVALSPTPSNKMPLAPRLAASFFMRWMTASVLPCAVKEKECLLELSRSATSSYRLAGGRR